MCLWESKTRHSVLAWNDPGLRGRVISMMMTLLAGILGYDTAINTGLRPSSHDLPFRPKASACAIRDIALVGLSSEPSVPQLTC